MRLRYLEDVYKNEHFKEVSIFELPGYSKTMIATELQLSKIK